MPNFSLWNVKEEFTMIEAAYILCGIEPPVGLTRYHDTYLHDCGGLPESARKEILTMHQLLDNVFNPQCRLTHIPTISKNELREFATRMGLKLPEANLVNNSPVNKPQILKQSKFSPKRLLSLFRKGRGKASLPDANAAPVLNKPVQAITETENKKSGQVINTNIIINTKVITANHSDSPSEAANRNKKMSAFQEPVEDIPIDKKIESRLAASGGKGKKRWKTKPGNGYRRLLITVALVIVSS